MLLGHHLGLFPLSLKLLLERITLTFQSLQELVDTYFFCIMYFEGLNLSHTLLASNFISNSENIVMYYGNPTSNITSGEFAVNSSALIRMTAGDTCYAHTAVTGSTKTVTIAGGQGNTQFGGYLVC